MTLEEYRALLENLVKDPSLQPKEDGTTYCNFAVSRIAKLWGCNEFIPDENGDPPLANRMCDIMALSDNFQVLTARSAIDAAMKPSLVIAAHRYGEHGHVAIVYPSAPYFSPSLQHYVPYLANVGKKNGISPESQDFPVADTEPTYYLFGSKV